MDRDYSVHRVESAHGDRNGTKSVMEREANAFVQFGRGNASLSKNHVLAGLKIVTKMIALSALPVEKLHPRRRAIWPGVWTRSGRIVVANNSSRSGCLAGIPTMTRANFAFDRAAELHRLDCRRAQFPRRGGQFILRLDATGILHLHEPVRFGKAAPQGMPSNRSTVLHRESAGGDGEQQHRAKRENQQAAAW